MAKPSVLPEWASTLANDPTTGQPNRVEPAGSKKVTGWNYNEKPPRQYMNWFQWLVYKWVEWFDSNIDQGVKTTDSPTFDTVSCGGVSAVAIVEAGMLVKSPSGDFTDSGAGVLTTDIFTSNGFSKLGSDAPTIKQKLVSGTLTSPGVTYDFAHGVTMSKILSYTVLLVVGSSLIIPLNPQDAAYYINSTNFVIENNTAGSCDVKCLITYTE